MHVARTRSSRASIHHPAPSITRDRSGSWTPPNADHPAGGDRYDDDEYDYHTAAPPQPQLTRTKSTRSRTTNSTRLRSNRQSERLPSKQSQATMRSFVRPGALPAHFILEGDNVTLQVVLPWTERLKERPCRFHITGVDGKAYSLEIDYQWTKMVQGSAKFRGAGLPRERGLGRGHLIIE